MDACGWRTVDASLGHISVIPAGVATGKEVINHTYGAMDVGMLTLLAFLTYGEHLF